MKIYLVNILTIVFLVLTLSVSGCAELLDPDFCLKFWPNYLKD